MTAASKPTLVLHIGLPKTGSTALQNGLAINRDALSQRGLFYAPVGVKPGTPPQRIFGGNGGALDLFLTSARRPAGYDPARFDLADYISPDHPVSLISSEWLSAAREARLIDFRDATAASLDIKVVAVIRNLDAHARSAWIQALKTDAYCGGLLDYCLEKYDHNYQYRRLRLFRKIFGPERVTVLHYDTLSKSVLKSFLEAISISGDGLAEPAKLNRGLTERETNLMRRTNALHRSPLLSRALSSLLIMRRPNAKSWNHVPEAVIALLTKRHSEELRWANDRFFGKKDVWRVATASDSAVRTGTTATAPSLPAPD